MMTKKHFVRIAEILKNRNADEWMIGDFAIFFSEENPNFDYGKFVKACKGNK